MLKPATAPPRISTMVLLTALSTLSMNMFLPSLSNIAVTFQTDYAIAALSIAGYLAVTAVLQLVMGPLSDRYGRRPILLSALAIFVAASLGCALATDIWIFLGFRVLQGIVISGWVMSQAAIRDMVSPREAASLMGYVVMAMAVAPMMGPIFGGILDEAFGWRSSFLVFAGMGTAMFVLCWLKFGETNTNRSATFTKQFRAYPELFLSRRFWGYAICTAFSTGTFYTFLSGVPLVARSALELPPAMLGFYMGTITAGFIFGSFLSGRYAKRFALTTMMIAGRVSAGVGLTLGLALFLSGHVNVFTFFGATLFVGFGNGLTMPSSNAGALSVRPGLAGSASGLAGALTVGIGAVLTSATGAILTDTHGVFQLFGVMLSCVAVGLLAALTVLWIDRREAQSS
jgi:Bcr/CflA subfamily drug resistance transporter